jgi:hypothetical protein
VERNEAAGRHSTLFRALTVLKRITMLLLQDFRIFSAVQEALGNNV